MAPQDNNTFHDFLEFAQQTSQTIADAVQTAATLAGETLGQTLYEVMEESTETVGNFVTPIVTHPMIKFATRAPGISWLMAALGQVNVEAVQQEVESLRSSHPLDSAETLVQRVITETAWKAAGVGLAANAAPPLTPTLLAVDLGAIAALQAQMIYRIAALYGFSPTQPARRGEVLLLWVFSATSLGAMKAGLSPVERVPVVGAAAGSLGNAAMLYGLGQVAWRFYEAKQNAMTAAERDRSQDLL